MSKKVELINPAKMHLGTVAREEHNLTNRERMSAAFGKANWLKLRTDVYRTTEEDKEEDS
jgi:hypothetical protein